MASLKITVPTVAAGERADTELLEQIARTGKGRYYFINDPSQVPQIFARETVTASKSAIDEQAFLPVLIRATHALADLDMESAPFLNAADVELTVIDPNLKRQPIAIGRSAPGRYAGDIELPVSGSYHMEINVKQNGQTVYRQSRGVMRGYSDELRIRPTDETLLKQVAEICGGRHNPTAAELFQPTDAIANRPNPLWPWLLTVVAFLLILDVALLRIDIAMTASFSRSRISPARAAGVE